MVGDKEKGPITPLQIFSPPLMSPIKGIITLNGNAGLFSLQAELIKTTILLFLQQCNMKKTPGRLCTVAGLTHLRAERNRILKSFV